MKVLMRLFAAGVPLGLAFFLVSFLHFKNEGVLRPEGIIALAEKHLLITAFCLMLLVVVPVIGMLVGFSWHFRAGNKKARYTPEWHENKALEIVWWCIPGVIILALGLITWKSTHDLDPYKTLDTSVKPLVVEVVALDWKWLFIYPEEGVATVNFVELPKDRPVLFYVTSDAPMNGFWIPQLAGQVYAMPGMSAQLNLLGTKVGDYRGMSSNFSGDGFSGMKFVARVAEEQDFTGWITNVKNTGGMLMYSDYEALAKQSSNNPVALYGSVENNLYHSIIMKYMGGGESGQKEKMGVGMKMDGM